MGHIATDTSAQNAGARLPIKMPAELARLMCRAKAVAEEVSAALKQILDHHQDLERNLAIER